MENSQKHFSFLFNLNVLIGRVMSLPEGTYALQEPVLLKKETDYEFLDIWNVFLNFRETGYEIMLQTVEGEFNDLLRINKIRISIPTERWKEFRDLVDQYMMFLEGGVQQ